MSDGILARKVGMTQIYQGDGTCIPVTVLSAGPCVVVRHKSEERDGYRAVQLGFDEVPEKKVTKPLGGYFKKHKVSPKAVLKEIVPDNPEKYKDGEKVVVEDVFAAGDKVAIVGTSKGKGFAGVMKRWGFHGGPATHGSMFHRAPGAIGCSAYPSRTIKGKKMPGHLGNKRVTVKNLKIVDIPQGKNLLLVKGAVPGSKGSLVIVSKVG